jgi:hypothetical protein
MEVSGQLNAPAVFAPGYPLDRRLGGPQNRSGLAVQEKYSQPPPEIEPRSSDCLARSQSIYMYVYIKCIKEEMGLYSRAVIAQSV